MRRRKFIALVGGAVAWPSVAHTQQPTPTIGFLNGTSPEGYGLFLSAFREGLGDAGYVEGRNITIEYRWAEGHYDRLPALAADLVRRQVSVIAATSTPANIIAKGATSTIPIVFTTSSNPVELGLVTNLSRPGGNVTGAATLNVELGPKRQELLHALVPTATSIVALVNQTNANVETLWRDVQASARALGQEVLIESARTEADIDAIFARLAQRRAGALLVDTDAFLFSRRNQLIALAKQYRVPAIFDRREFVAAGGLMSYGGSVTEVYHLAGIYTGRILKGEKPGDLPVQQATKVEFVINLKTAKALGLTIPPSLLARADEVIE